MKKVLFVVPGLGIGGVERSLTALLKQAPSAQLDITLMTFVPGGELSGEIPANIRVVCGKRAGRAEKIRGTISGALKAKGFHRIFRMLKKAYHRLGYTLFAGRNTHEQYDTAIAYADGLATWYVAQNVTANCKIAFVHTDIVQAGYDIQTERQVYSDYDWIFFGSAASKTCFLSQMPEFSRKAKLLPNTVDAAEVRRLSGLGNPFREDCPHIKIVTVGRLSHEKGVAKIPELLHRLNRNGRRAVWYIVGDGPERQKLAQYARDLGETDALVLVGPQQNPYPYIRCCDIYVQPSDYEGYCIALAEARILCRPVIACRFAGAEEQIMDGKTGYVTGMHPDDIFPALRELVEHPIQRARFSEALARDANGAEDSGPAAQWWEWISTL